MATDQPHRKAGLATPYLAVVVALAAADLLPSGVQRFATLLDACFGRCAALTS